MAYYHPTTNLPDFIRTEGKVYGQYIAQDEATGGYVVVAWNRGVSRWSVLPISDRCAADLQRAGTRYEPQRVAVTA